MKLHYVLRLIVSATESAMRTFGTRALLQLAALLLTLLSAHPTEARDYSAEHQSAVRLITPADTLSVAPNHAIRIDFSGTLDGKSVTAETLTLSGPEGQIPINVHLESNGSTIVITPKRDLYPMTVYNVFVSGLDDNYGSRIDFSALTFITTAPNESTSPDDSASPSEPSLAAPITHSDRDDLLLSSATVDAERWMPSVNNRHAKWRTGRVLPDDIVLRRNEAMTPASLVVTQQTKSARDAPSSISGVVLTQSDSPLPRVKLSIDNKTTITDADGEFTLRGLPPGHHELVVDGRTASADPTSQYGYFVIGVDVDATKGTPIAPIYLPKITSSDWIQIASPTAEATTVTTPAVPGMEIHIPKGAVLRDHEGKLVTRIAIVPLPLDRSPFPFPENAPAYVTVQPGGMVVQGLSSTTSEGVRVHYPNQTDLAAGTRVSFWSYQSDERGWQIYGDGAVSSDGQQVVPDPGVGLYESLGFMYTENNPPPPPFAPPPGGGPGDGPNDGSNGGGDPGTGNGPDGPDGPQTANGNGTSGTGATGDPCNTGQAGDPVDCKSGLFVFARTDTSVNGVIPINFTRIYRPADPISRSFGNGNQSEYAMYLREAAADEINGRYTIYDLILPDGSFVRFTRTSPGNDFTQVIAPHYTSASSWYASVLDYENGNYVVTKKNGTKYIFSLFGTLLEIADRKSNQLYIAHNGGQITRITSTSGRYVDLQYDSSNRITGMTDFAGRTWGYQYTGNNLVKATYPDGTYENYGYDAAGNMNTVVDRNGTTIVTNRYDANSRVSQQTLANSGVYGFNYTLDGNGSVTAVAVTDPLNNVKTITFGSLGYKASTTYAYGTSLAETTSFERDPTSGLLTALVDPRSRRTTFQRDGFGNISQITKLAGTSGAVSWSFQHANPFNLLTQITNPAGKLTKFGYDAVGNLKTITDPLGHATTFTPNAAGQVGAVSDALSHTWTLAYDPNGDIRNVTDPLGHTVRRDIDSFGRTMSIVDALGRTASVTRDSEGRIVSMIDPAGQTTYLNYDNNGNLKKITNPMSGVTTFTYDTANRLKSRTDALNQTEYWTYDALGNLKTYTDRKNQTTTYDYDALNRPTKVTFNDGSFLKPQFDSGNRMVGLTDSVYGAMSWTYDELNELLQEQSPQGSVVYTYDSRGRRQTMTPASQIQITYGYDDANRLTSITQGAELVQIAYDNANRRSKLTLPNGINSNYSFNNANGLTAITVLNASGASQGALNYTLNQANWPATETSSFSTELLPLATTGANSFDLNNREATWGGFNLSYDSNGDLNSNSSSAPPLSYNFDVRHRLTSIHQGSSVLAQFVYDGLNRRVSKTIGGTTTNFLYDSWNVVQESVASQVSPILTGLRIDERFARTEAAGRMYFVSDALNSTVALFNANAAITQTYTYEPYGQVSSSGSSSNPYQYTGRENDGTGLYYFRARYYSPTTKRFVSEDPMGFTAGLNQYAYALGNPLFLNDPWGLDAQYAAGACVTAAFFAGLGACASLGITTDGTIGGSTLFVQLAGNAMVGVGGFFGLGTSFNGGHTEGPLQSGFDSSAYGEFDFGTGGSFSINGSGNSDGWTGSTGVGPGGGLGVYLGGGVQGTATGVFPTPNQIGQAITDGMNALGSFLMPPPGSYNIPGPCP